MTVISVDDLVDNYAKSVKKTFDFVYFDKAPDIYNQLDAMLRRALQMNQHVIIDLDDLITVAGREYYLQIIRGMKTKHKLLAWYFLPPFNHKERHEKREHYPFCWEDVVDTLAMVEPPTLEEGFDEVIPRRM